MNVAPDTIVLWSDIACPWATLAVHRLRTERARAGLTDRIRIDHRAFPLELVNSRPTPMRVLSAEVPVVGQLAPSFGWQVWQAPDAEWPVTTLPALEAVQAAKDQGLAASEALDFGLRRALFTASRCISMRHVVLDVAESLPEVDAEALAQALDDGRARATVIADWHDAEKNEVKGSPHFFLFDGSDLPNPGITMHWEGSHGRGFPVVDVDDDSIYARLLQRAAAAA